MSSAFASSPAAADAAALPESSLNAAAQPVLAAYAEQPGDPDIWQRLLAFRRAAAASIAGLPANKKNGPGVDSALQLIQTFAASGGQDHLAAPEDVELARGYGKKGWPGLLAAMLLVPAWQWPEAPRLDDAPMWLWSAYTAYLFYSPQGFCACGLADAYAAHYLRRLSELVRLAEFNPGSTAVRGALQTYLETGNCIPLYISTDSLRRHYELRGRLLTIASGVGPQEELFPGSLEGRRMRIGFVNRHFAAQTETYTTLPMFEQLDPERFEVILFAHHSTQSPLETYARSRVAEFHLLPEGVDAQVQALRDAALDVVVFGTNVTAVYDDVTRLALYRLAPLQVVNNSSCTTSGLPEIDLYVSGTLTESPEAAAHFSERLGLLSGPAHAFNYEADKQESAACFTRSSLGLPDDGIVFVSAADLRTVTPEMQRMWTRLLGAVPNSHLLVQLIGSSGVAPSLIKRFSATFDHFLKTAGVDDSRLHIAAFDLATRADRRDLLAVGNVYLGTYPVDEIDTIISPLELGMPLVVREGAASRSRRCAGLLRSIGLGECVALDEDKYFQLGVGLATDPESRQKLHARLEDAMNKTPPFMDTLAASEAFGELMLRAYDEIAANGRETFRKETRALSTELADDPDAVLATSRSFLEIGMLDDAQQQANLVLAAQPTSVSGRQIMAHILLARGNVVRAIDYLLAAVQGGNAPAEVWRDLAGALQRAGKGESAITALETALRIDPRDVESLFMLGDMAARCGHQEILGEVNTILANLAPDDPRRQPLREVATGPLSRGVQP